MPDRISRFRTPSDGAWTGWRPPIPAAEGRMGSITTFDSARIGDWRSAEQRRHRTGRRVSGSDRRQATLLNAGGKREAACSEFIVRGGTGVRRVVAPTPSTAGLLLRSPPPRPTRDRILVGNPLRRASVARPGGWGLVCCACIHLCEEGERPGDFDYTVAAGASSEATGAGAREQQARHKRDARKARWSNNESCLVFDGGLRDGAAESGRS